MTERWNKMSDEQKLKASGRLAMRHEGNFWNAYFALPDTMDGAVLIGSIVIAGVAGNDNLKKAFMQLMWDVVADILEVRSGVRPTHGEVQGAPEHERAGHS